MWTAVHSNAFLQSSTHTLLCSRTSCPRVLNILKVFADHAHIFSAYVLPAVVICPLGDFNTVPDRHLAGASLGRLCPDLFISESTYAASVREGKAARESSLIAQVRVGRRE